MSDAVDRISDHDDAEAARIRRVATKNDVVFGSLVQAIKNRVSKYNKRHPQGFGFQNAVLIDEGPHSSTNWSLKIQKNVEPLSSLTLEFPINSGAMEAELSAMNVKFSGRITLDVANNTPTYDFNSTRHSAGSLAECLLGLVFSADEGFLDAGRKIGFV